jgi:hypothetical protein
MSNDPSTAEGEQATYHQPNWTVGVVNQTLVQGDPATGGLASADLAALAAGGLQILSYFRRPPWER